MPALLKLVDYIENHESQFVQLARQFFSRFFDHELVSRSGDARGSVTQILALLAVPGFFVPFLLMPRYTMLVHLPRPVLDMAVWFDKCFFLSFAMAVMGFVTVFEWEALFPDRRDYLILTPLPIRARTIFAAKIAALCLFLVIFAVDLNAFSPLMYPLVVMDATPERETFFYAASFVAAHGASALAACAFIFFFFVALHGGLANLLSARAFKRFSPYVQLLSLSGSLALLLLFPRMMSALRPLRPVNEWAVYLFPPMWFLGLYETLLGRTEPVFRTLAGISMYALGGVVAATAAAYALSYRRHTRRSLETASSSAAGKASIEAALAWVADRLVVRSPAERAVFHFVGKTLARSRKHKLLLAAYLGVGLALVLDGLAAVYARWGYGGMDHPTFALVSVPLVLSFFLLAGLRVGFAIPAELRANWVFQLTECEQSRECLSGARKAVMVFAILPLFGSLAPFYVALWGWQTAALHTCFGMTLSLILMELLLLKLRKIPFTCSYVPGKARLNTRWFLYLMAFTTYAYTMSRLELWMLKSPMRLVVFYGLAFSVLGGVIALRDRLQAGGFALVFDEEPEPVVRTLNLSY